MLSEQPFRTPESPRKRMQRIERANTPRFLTFSCYRRLTLFESPRARDVFADRLAAMRERHAILLVAWVVMPEHVHLIVMPRPPSDSIVDALWWLKREVAKMLIGEWLTSGEPMIEQMTTTQRKRRFWQAGGGYDRVIRGEDDLREKIRYIHLNPVRRGLVKLPEQWKWSSARWYKGAREGQVPMDRIGE